MTSIVRVVFMEDSFLPQLKKERIKADGAFTRDLTAWAPKSRLQSHFWQQQLQQNVCMHHCGSVFWESDADSIVEIIDLVTTMTRGSLLLLHVGGFHPTLSPHPLGRQNDTGALVRALSRAVCRSVGLSVCRSVGLSVCRSVGLSVCRSVGLSVCRSVGRSIDPSIHRSIDPSICYLVCAIIRILSTFFF